MHTKPLIALATVALTAPLLVAPAAASAAPAEDTLGLHLTGGGSSLLEAQSQRIAPGLDHVAFSRLEGAGWVTGDILVADLTTPTLSLDVVDSGSITTPARVSDQVAGSGAVAAVNGDYFDMNATNAPVGTNVTSEGIRTGSASPREAFTIADGLAAVQQLTARGTLPTPAGPVAINAFNAPSIPADGIGVYTAAWGDYTLNNAAGGAQRVSRASVVDGVVTEVAQGAGAPEIPDGGHVLLGREAGADAIGALQVGDAVTIEVGPSADVDLAVSGSQRLVIDGQKGTAEQVEAARTAVGVNRDGTEIYIVAIDGRASDSRGQTIQELAQLMLDLGAYNAVNLDGGGSTTMLARPAGAAELELVNRPSDGSERLVANSLVFFSSAPAEAATEVQVSPAVDGGDAVFPGLDRSVTATGLDANLGPVGVTGSFSAEPGLEVRSAEASSAVVTGMAPGNHELAFTSESGLTGTAPLRVLGELDRIEGSSRVISFLQPDESTTFRVTGYDGDGHTAPVEVSDVSIDAGPEVSIEPAGIDAFTIRPLVESGATTLRVDVAGHRFEAAVTVGLAEDVVLDFADAAAWRQETARATGTLAAAPAAGPDGQDALSMTHDFTTSTGTRGMYAIAPQPIELPGQPRAVTLWINGDGTGAWPRLQVRAAGATAATNLDGPTITWEGWRKVEFTVPAGIAYPLAFERIRIMETRSTAQYQGSLQFAELGIVYAPEVDQPQATPVFDPLIMTNGTADDSPLRVAVVSDSQFVARNPDSEIVAAARRTLQEVVAADPDLLVINGDFVDEASPADFDLARRILDEEVGDAVPYIYVPGNHEVMGGDIANFEAAFGDTRTARDIEGTRIITLNSASGSLGQRGGAIDQLQFLEDQLADAADDPDITGVTVFFHHPTQDHLVGDHSQLSDRVEARELEATFAEFRAETGKSIAAVNAHVGNFSGRSSEGVSYLTNGNSGKSPSGAAELGGFTGWTMLGIDPARGVVGAEPAPVVDRTAWLRAEVRPRVDELTLSGVPETLPIGGTAQVSGTVSQDGTREVPVAWPMSARWGGEGVVVDDGALRALEASAQVVRLNPATGELTAVAPGTATVELTVNGVTRAASVTVPAAPGGTPEQPGEEPETPQQPGDGDDADPGPGDGAGDGDGSSDAPRPGSGDPGDAAADRGLAATGAEPGIIAAGLLLLIAGLATTLGLAAARRRRTR
ncbi:phosphodiester glycosidase family protein [Microbacterium sp. Marseille-Q6965]|uniref:phosphodiester glycosidase family protein n=1 Tax=Microbacterium sp. Marseille-Q6965 TaxID=2965072 RepID=UPI0021B81B14|nr:phosphodiester glycosidase family protein [Microbacterium sp. Marseille-Q6965]